MSDSHAWRGATYASFAFVLTFCASCSRRAEQVLPDVASVKSISMQFDQPEFFDDPVFPGAIEDWAAIRANLLPASAIDHDADWEVLGNLELVSKSGEKTEVGLFEDRPHVVFNIGEDFYRGGNLEDLRLQLETAYENSLRSDEVQ